MTKLDKPGKLKGLLENGLYYEYTKAADPIGSGSIAKIPFAEFGTTWRQATPELQSVLPLARPRRERAHRNRDAHGIGNCG